MTVRVVPDPQQQCGLAVLVLVASWALAGTGAFIAGSFLARRIWPEVV